jgi:hypothetical protein
MEIDNLLSRLDGVKKTGSSKWVARCPAHQDKSPSLAIRELDDGRILIHCFSSCSTEDVLRALDLNFSDLMPESVGHFKKGETRPFSAMDALRCISFEVLLVATTACRLTAGETLQNGDRERLLLATARIRGALNGVGL